MSRILYVTASKLKHYPKLQDSMFKDRAQQFVDRLQWSALKVDHRGWERDEYDLLDPLYVIWMLPDGTHGASMRLMPTSGPNMLHDHFAHVLPNQSLRSPLIWECTRFVVSKRAKSTATAALFVGAGELFRGNELSAMVGLFDRRMLRVYKLMNNYPEIIGSDGDGSKWLAAGLWKMSNQVWINSLKLLGIDQLTSKQWYDLRVTDDSCARYEVSQLVA